MKSPNTNLPNILIVDDIEENIQYLENIIETFEVNIIKAYSAQEALAKTTDVDLALAIIDVWMPNMNGYELARILNDSQRENKVPVVFLTASLTNEIEKIKGYNSGAVDYIFKPVNTTIIKGKVNIFLDLYNQKQKIFNDALELKKYSEELSNANHSLKISEEKERNLSSELKNTLDNLEIIVEQRTEELSRSEDLYLTTVNSLTDWICVIDENLKVIFTNNSLKQLLTKNDITNSLTNKTLKEALFFLDNQHLNLYMQAFETGEAIQIEDKFNLFGNDYYLQIKLSPVIRKNKVVRIVTTIYDDTKHKLAEEEMLKNLEREKNLNSMKSQFISTVSHEFRTPLAGIHSSVQLLQNFDKKWDDDKKVKLFNQIYNAINRTKSLLDDISLLDKQKCPDIDINPKPMNIQELIISIIDENRQAFGNDVIIETNFDFPEPVCNVDENALRTILGNVISNAIKYCGSVQHIQLEAAKTSMEMKFKVTDFGIGIPANEMSLLFEPFSRASNTGNIQGTGFGLSIVKRYVDTCKGIIDVKSEINKGTTVTIIIPCALK